MADRTLRIRMLLEAGERVTRPLRDIAAGSDKTAQALKATRDRLKEIKSAQADIASFRELKTGLRTTGEALQSARERAADLARVMKAAENPTRAMTRDFNKAKLEAADLGRAFDQQQLRLQQVRDRLSATGISTRHLGAAEQALRADLRATNAELSEQGRRMVQANDRAKRLAQARSAFQKTQGAAGGMAASGAAGIATGIAVGGPLVASSKQAMSLEEEMAGVAKVTNMSGEALRRMTDEVVTLSTKIPMTAPELAKIAAAAGAAGVGMDKFGNPLRTQREDLIAFTDTAARMGIAFDMTADDAGGTMAKWRQAFKMTQPEVEALGDRVNALTNKFGGQAPAVSGIITRIGPLGKVAGVAASQIAALASSMNSAGIEEEIAATGIKNTMLALTKGDAATKSQVKAFEALGLSATNVAKRMQVDGSGTIVDVLSRVARLSPDKQASMLDQLFGSESIAAIAPLLTNLDGLQQRLGLVGDRAKYSGSMTQEFLSRINTTQGATDLAVNGLQSVNIALGQSLLPTIKAGAQNIGQMAASMRAFATRFPGIARWAMIATGILAGLFFVFGAGAIALAGIMGPIAIINAGLVAMGVAGGVASIGLAPIIGVVLAVVGAVALLYAAWNHWGEISAAWFAFWGAIRNGFIAAGNWLATTGVGLFKTAGLMIMRGLLGGIDPGIVLAKIRAIGLGAVRMFKSVLGIHSPSRVFAGLGGYMMQGLTNGIAGGEDGPVGRLNGLSRRMTSAIAVGSMAASGAAPAGAAGRGSAGPPRAARAAAVPPVNIHVHGAPGQDEATLAQLVAREVAKVMAGQSSNRGRYADEDEF
ncbi:phage tail tape measure protein [Sphingomonas melonis]|uniref:phage tail tape measure protein n=1 Tax=Sphingomonas melonis TaxID=152682 RepID=UPI0035C7BA54